MSKGLIVPNGRILVKEIVTERKSAGGIILTGESDPQNKARLGEVVSNSMLVNNQPNDLYKVGGKLFFGKFAGASLTHEYEEYISLLESEIVAVVL